MKQHRLPLFLVLCLAINLCVLVGCTNRQVVEASETAPESEDDDDGELVIFVTPTPEPTDEDEPTPTAAVSATPAALTDPTDTPTPTPEAPISIVNVGSNLRDGPGTFYDIITGLVFETEVQLEGRNTDSDWVYITASDDREGWIFRILVDFSDEEVAAAPILDAEIEPIVPPEETAVAEVLTEEPTPPTEEVAELPVETEEPTEGSVASGNLLVNGSFEEPYYRIATAEGGGAIATGWTAWWFNDAGDTYQVPEYEIAPLFRDPFRVRTGNAAQQLFRPSTRWLAGVYQQVNIEPGTRLRLTIWGHAWSTFCIPREDDEPICDSRDSNREGRGAPLFMRVGIDPTGGTDAFSENIVWSVDQVIWDNYAPFTVEAVASSGTVTVFTYGAPEFAAPINNAYWDDAELVIIE